MRGTGAGGVRVTKLLVKGSAAIGGRAGIPIQVLPVVRKSSAAQAACIVLHHSLSQGRKALQKG